MRSLFVRIFMSYWLATGLVLVLAVGMTSWVAWERLRAFDELDPEGMIRAAAQALITRQRPGLVQWTKTANASMFAPNIYVLDDHGKDLLGRRMSPMTLRRAELEIAAVAAGRPWARGPRYAGMISDPRAGTYLLVITATSSGAWAALGNMKVLSLLFLVALLVSGLICWLVTRTISGPIVRLQNSARALASGDLNARVPAAITRRSDEIGALAYDFNAMAEKLRSMLASKETLMRDLSHELRSPLARLRVALGLARANTATTEVQFGRMEREAEKMDALIGQLLRLSRLMNVELRPKMTPLDLSLLVSEVVDDARIEALGADKNLAWHDPGEFKVMADGAMLRHAFENVLRNALRFSPKDQPIDVELHRDGAMAVLRISDRGPGVPESELERIFEPFYRVHISEGTGVGLAITAKVIELHAGRVLARNRAGGGLEVEFRLPASNA